MQRQTAFTIPTTGMNQQRSMIISAVSSHDDFDDCFKACQLRSIRLERHLMKTEQKQRMNHG